MYLVDVNKTNSEILIALLPFHCVRSTRTFEGTPRENVIAAFSTSRCFFLFLLSRTFLDIIFTLKLTYPSQHLTTCLLRATTCTSSISETLLEDRPDTFSEEEKMNKKANPREKKVAQIEHESSDMTYSL